VIRSEKLVQRQDPARIGSDVIQNFSGGFSRNGMIFDGLDFGTSHSPVSMHAIDGERVDRFVALDVGAMEIHEERHAEQDDERSQPRPAARRHAAVDILVVRAWGGQRTVILGAVFVRRKVAKSVSPSISIATRRRNGSRSIARVPVWARLADVLAFIFFLAASRPSPSTTRASASVHSPSNDRRRGGRFCGRAGAGDPALARAAAASVRHAGANGQSATADRRHGTVSGRAIVAGASPRIRAAARRLLAVDRRLHLAPGPPSVSGARPRRPAVQHLARRVGQSSDHRDPLHLFDANIYYPARFALTDSDSVIVPSLMVAPLSWLGVHQVVVYNVLMMLSFALSGITMFYFVRALTGRSDAALIAAGIFALYRIASNTTAISSCR
jgi:hypothetical protein